MNALASHDLEAQAARLLLRAGFPGDGVSVTPIPGGRNNRVYRVDSAAGTHLLKRYFHHPRDPRDRLAHESAFLAHLERHGCRLAPRLLAALPGEHAALLEFVQGDRLDFGDIDDNAVDQASEFFRQANLAPAPQLRPASEACFSINEHLVATQRRVDRLAQIVIVDDLDVAAERFHRSELTPAWEEIRAGILAEWPSPERRKALLPSAERCVSPSDFGFHNALREPGGRLRFLDFEYAGCDDPAKLICDFANQPDLLLPRPLSDRFTQAVIATHTNPSALAQRVATLEPLYQLKWACICLNEFLATGRSRRDFTDGNSANDRPRRERQLNRARQMLDRATTPLHHVAAR